MIVVRQWHILLVALVLCVLPQRAQADEAADFINDIGKRVVAILSDKGMADAAKDSQLQMLFKESVDVDWIGRFVLGKYWRTASEAQQQRYLDNYSGFLIKSYTSKFKEYTGSETYKILDSKTDDQGRTVVTMELVRPGQANVLVDYKLRKEDGKLRVFDIVVEGVSLLTTQRSEFASVVSRKGLDYLIDQLQKRAQG